MSLDVSDLEALFQEKLKTPEGRAKLLSAFTAYAKEIARHSPNRVAAISKNLKCEPTIEGLVTAFETGMTANETRDGLYRLIRPTWC